MNFKGRYWTVNRTFVVVHENLEATEGDREIRWTGHGGNENTVFWWNENGECVATVPRLEGAEWLARLGNYDLYERVNPQSVEGGGNLVVDCPQCRGERYDTRESG